MFNHQPGKRAPDPAKVKRNCWRGEFSREDIPNAKAKDLLEDDDALATWLEKTQIYGLSLVTSLDNS